VKPLKLGISTCPNDTFLFHALLQSCIETPGVELQIELLDIQQLNQKLKHNELDVGKVSFALLAQLRETYTVLPVGAALGFGVGPILVGRSPTELPKAHSKVLCPGVDTTATLLFRSFFPECSCIQHAVFSEIMPAILEGRADYGVLIHEGRFTYQQQGLSLIADLGQRWETRYQLPLPLGGLVASKQLAPETLQLLTHYFRQSLQYAHAHRQEALKSMRQYAQEFSEEVLWQHVELYVNQHTWDLGEVGGRALELLVQLKQQQST
jgi:1,4-dihydroxy-6-naphthoate synthase